MTRFRLKRRDPADLTAQEELAAVLGAIEKLVVEHELDERTARKIVAKRRKARRALDSERAGQ